MLDLTQDELARRAGCSVSAIRKLEADERRPSLRVARSLADALQIAPHERAAFLLAAGGAAGAPPAAIHRQTVAAGSPAPSSPVMLAGRLPAPLTSFVGRQRELAEVRTLLGRKEAPARLLTLTGPGGSGKTRLALEVAATQADDFPDGIGWVELGILAEDELVPQAVATVLGAKEAPPSPIEVTLAAYLRPRRTLIVLDNCEHLIQACAELATALLRQCPDLQILATSREALQILGEVTVNVPPLALPRVEGAQNPSLLQEIESVRLLVERAQAARGDLALTQANSAAVVEICRRLDGIPLALELAATRLRALTLEQLAARLDDRFRLLTGGSRAALPRQQTLRALIGWSHDLLPRTDRRQSHGPPPPTDPARAHRVEPRAAELPGADALPAAGGVRRGVEPRSRRGRDRIRAVGLGRRPRPAHFSGGQVPCDGARRRRQHAVRLPGDSSRICRRAAAGIR